MKILIQVTDLAVAVVLNMGVADMQASAQSGRYHSKTDNQYNSITTNVILFSWNNTNANA